MSVSINNSGETHSKQSLNVASLRHLNTDVLDSILLHLNIGDVKQIKQHIPKGEEFNNLRDTSKAVLAYKKFKVATDEGRLSITQLKKGSVFEEGLPIKIKEINRLVSINQHSDIIGAFEKGAYDSHIDELLTSSDTQTNVKNAAQSRHAVLINLVQEIEAGKYDDKLVTNERPISSYRPVIRASVERAIENVERGHYDSKIKEDHNFENRINSPQFKLAVIARRDEF